ncbi:class I adenylate-forming enzyme family protein [Dendrosporobacter sp. 1207_IL3150]|uniref:class I adenylate-forming enzyme family protein n=1 Tax=Dendrosporobacter sp. 1207_IL3150 TaxID=3084054 RepID=UPI002FD8ADF5
MLVHELINQGKAEKIVFHTPRAMTYNELKQEVEAYRNFFYHSGVRQSDNVGLLSRNSIEFVCSYIAIASLGAVVVPLNFQLNAREIEYIVNDSGMKLLISMEKLDLEVSSESLKLITFGEIKEVLHSSQLETAPEIKDISQDQPCVIIYTSGTTGKPKGAVLTHNNLVSNARAFGEVLEVNSNDNALCVLPMYHCFGWTCAVLNPLLCGAAITVLDAFSPKETITAIKENNVTIFYGVPPMYNILSRLGIVEDLDSVRIFVSGGASLPEKVAEQFYQKFGINVTEGYGLSEASPVVTFNPPRQTKYCSIGKAIPGVEVKIVDETCQELKCGQVGELIVRGPNVMKGYYNLPKETEKALIDGWLHTGDLAYKDEEGYYFIVDRLKDMIITNGENIYPREIEELLYAYPGIVEAAVIGIPNELRGQEALAYIVLSEAQNFNKKALREYLLDNLAAYKIPRDFIIIEALPKNSTGKILKRLLREF